MQRCHHYWQHHPFPSATSSTWAGTPSSDSGACRWSRPCSRTTGLTLRGTRLPRRKDTFRTSSSGDCLASSVGSSGRSVPLSDFSELIDIELAQPDEAGPSSYWNPDQYVTAGSLSATSSWAWLVAAGTGPSRGCRPRARRWSAGSTGRSWPLAPGAAVGRRACSGRPRGLGRVLGRTVHFQKCPYLNANWKLLGCSLVARFAEDYWREHCLRCLSLSAAWTETCPQ